MTLWTLAHQAPLSMGFSRLEYWSWLPCPPPGDLPDPGIKLGVEPVSLTSPALVDRFFISSNTWEALCIRLEILKTIMIIVIAGTYYLPDAILTLFVFNQKRKKKPL